MKLNNNTTKKLQEILNETHIGEIKISKKGVPYISAENYNIVWFWKTRKYRLFRLQDKLDFTDKAELIHFLIEEKISEEQYPF